MRGAVTHPPVLVLLPASFIIGLAITLVIVYVHSSRIFSSSTKKLQLRSYNTGYRSRGSEWKLTPGYSAQLSNPTQNSFQFSLVSIDTPAAITTKLMPQPLNLTGQNNKTPFSFILLAETNLRGKATFQITNQTAKILDIAAFESFLQSMMYSKNFTMQVNGQTDAFLGPIKAPVNLNKQISLAGKYFLSWETAASSNSMFHRTPKSDRLQSCLPQTYLTPASRRDEPARNGSGPKLFSRNSRNCNSLPSPLLNPPNSPREHSSSTSRSKT